MVDRMFDLSTLTAKALEDAVKILDAYRKYGAPSDFWDEGVQIAYNENSGCVFLTNEDYQVAVLNDDDKLVSVYFTPYAGLEGTFEDLVDMFEDNEFENEEDIEYLKDIAEAMGEFSIVEKLEEALGIGSEVEEDAEN